MKFKTHKLKTPNNQYLESIFHFKDFMPDHSIERVVPTGHIFIIFELDNISRNILDNETLKPSKTFSKVWVSGMHRNYISISAHAKSEMFVLQFKAFGAYPYFHFPIDDLSEKIVPAEEVFGTDIFELREAILKPDHSKDKFAIAEKWLDARFDEHKTPPEDLLKMIERLQIEPADKYQEAVKMYPNTQKHLIDQFKKYVGLTPKYYQRILRFNEILQKIHKKQHMTWSQIAYNCACADQSHFIKEFKHFSGFNPQEFIQQDFGTNETNFFPLDRRG